MEYSDVVNLGKKIDVVVRFKKFAKNSDIDNIYISLEDMGAIFPKLDKLNEDQLLTKHLFGNYLNKEVKIVKWLNQGEICSCQDSSESSEVTITFDDGHKEIWAKDSERFINKC